MCVNCCGLFVGLLLAGSLSVLLTFNSLFIFAASLGNFYTAAGSVDNDYCEAQAYDCAKPFSDTFEARKPYFVAETCGVECAPETVVQVEPKSGEPNQVNDCENDAQTTIMEIVVNPVSAVARKSGNFFCTGKFGKHHLSPELSEVGDEAAQYDDTEYQHIFRRELHIFG